ncbi:MAG: aryl-sulfate sulfotransferase [Promethearchaeota archaeon]
MKPRKRFKDISRNAKLKILVGVALTMVSVFLPVLSIFNGIYVMYNDAEVLPDGNIMFCQYEIWRYQDQSKPGQRDAVVIVDPNGNVVRKIGDPAVILDRPHEALLIDTGNILIADTHNDRIVEINDTNNAVDWTYNLRLINWTVVNETLFPADSIINNFEGDDWSHVNDVDIINRSGSQYILVSSRNHDIIFEVNYTSARLKSTPDPADITWYYGAPGRWDLIKQQHNPDYLPNGNIIISDSENGRCIEVNYTTKKITWDTTTAVDLYWPRDCDQNPYDPDLYLITDSLHHRVIEFNRSSNKTTWTYSGTLIQPYQADYVTEDTIIISDGVGGRVILLNKTTKQITWDYQTTIGSNEFILTITIPIIITLAITFSFMLYDKVKRGLGKKKIKYWFNIGSLIFWLTFLVIITMAPQNIVKQIALTIDALIRGNK